MYLPTGFLDMSIQFLVLLSSLAIFASASPFPTARQTEPTTVDWRARLRGDTINDLNNLAAWNTAGNPLVLPIAGSTGGLSIHECVRDMGSERKLTL